MGRGEAGVLEASSYSSEPLKIRAETANAFFKKAGNLLRCPLLLFFVSDGDRAVGNEFRYCKIDQEQTYDYIQDRYGETIQRVPVKHPMNAMTFRNI